MVSLLGEFNIHVSNRNGGLRGTVESALENVDNGFSGVFCEALNTSWQHYLSIIRSVSIYDDCLETSITGHPDCQKLLKLEGVGTLNAVNLYIALGCAESGVFNNGKDASACIGLTPIQYSSGGKTRLGSIGKHVKNSVLRSQLISGAMSAVNHAVNRKAKSALPWH